jgi:hypothetical protein
MDPGGNEFSSGEAYNQYGLFDGRALATDSITCSFTNFNGLIPTAGKLTKTAMEPASVMGKYHIQTVGNSIEFF